LILAYWGRDALIALSPIELNLEESIRLDGTVLMFTLAVTLVTGFLFGLPSALNASRIKTSEAFKQGGSRGTMGTGTSRLRGALVMAEVALALVLLVGSSLLAKSFIRLLDVDTGFESDRVLTMRLDLPRSKYNRRHLMSGFIKDVLTRVENLPEVESAGVVNHVPLGGSDEEFRFWIAGRSYERHVDIPTAEIRSVGGDYFRAMGIPLLRGRLFTEIDESGGPGVAVINQTMARRFFPDTDPLGKELGISGPDGDMLTVVGVVGDVKHFGLDTETRSELYVPYHQEPWPYLALIVRSTSAEPLDVAPRVLEQVWAIDPDQPAYDIRTMEMRLSQSVAGRRFSMTLLSLFGGSALLLAVLGIYGVLAYSVAQRTREIGVRVALGAQSRDILNLVLKQGIVLSLFGIAIGLAGAFALTRALSSLLFEVGATDPMAFTAVPLVLLVVVVLACYIPARRAAKIDSIAAIRYE
jgi:putative ABC transport system permease protein